MPSFLLIPIRAVPFLLAGFGLISLLRRRFEAKQLIVNAITILIVYWVSMVVAAVLIVSSS